MLKQQLKHKKKQQGFTLLEILVVVGIMGFLIAMVAPRFAGVTSSVSSDICNTNKLRGQQMVSTFLEQTGRYPNHMVNLVMTDGETLANANYQVPYVDNQDPADGKEVLRHNHNQNFKFMIHHLNAAEAQELRNLGISRVFNLNDYGDVLNNLPEGASAGETVGRLDSAAHTGRTNNWQNVKIVAAGDQRPFMEEIRVDEGVGVIMSMVGANADGGFEYVGVKKPASGGNYFGRIIFGLGPESELVTRGIATNSGLTPTATYSEDFTWGGYYIVMPRLSATVARLQETEPKPAFDNIATGGPAEAFYEDFLTSGEVLALGMERGTDYQPGWITGAVNDNNRNFTRRIVDLLDPMPDWEFDSNPVHTDLRWAIAFGHDPNEEPDE
jgi:prepilin-type N-terminal cleavage/methylation domain-containing protein